MDKKINLKLLYTSSICSIVTLCSLIVPVASNAATLTNEISDITDSKVEYMVDGVKPLNLNDGNNNMEISDLNGKEFFIKNVYTGQYLDVSGGTAANGTNVQQYKYNGTDSQRWYMKYNGDATFSIYSRLGNNGSYKYALDIANASADNYANVQIYEINGTNAQKFQIGCTQNSTVVLYTVISNSSKAVVVNGPTCDQGRNVDQYTYQGHVNEQWILEPVNRDYTMGVYYARKNYDSYISAYPNVTKLGPNGGNCSNFVSQCMLASGIHYQNDWYVYRQNGTYTDVTTTDELDYSWELADPSPWISAKSFAKYWKPNASYHDYKGKEILNNPTLIANSNMSMGDVVQLADANLLGNLGTATHTMYVTEVQNGDCVLTYQSINVRAGSLLDLCKRYPNNYFILYDIM